MLIQICYNIANKHFTLQIHLKNCIEELNLYKNIANMHKTWMI